MLASNTSSIDNRLCDGDWHDVAFRNENGRLFVDVDNVMFGGETSFPLRAFDFTQFYVGGLPSKVMSDIVAVLDDDARSFGGCMRRFTIDSREMNLLHDVIMAYNVDLDGCPVGASNSQAITSRAEESADGSAFGSVPLPANVSCVDNNIETLYKGMNNSYTDSTISGFFTRYLYRVSNTQLITLNSS